MTPTALPLQRSEYPPFLPLNFFEAPQYSAYAPALPAASVVPTAPPPKRLASAASPKSPSKAGRKGRPPIIHTNALKPYLQSFSSPGHALAKLPRLGSIATGAVSLDYGKNAKPLGIKTALVLLRRLDVISTESILEYMRLSLRPCTERHAQRLAQCIRIIERAARAAKSEWPEPGHVDDADLYTTMHSIVPCSEQGCSICRPSAEVEQAWSLTAAEPDDPADTFATVDFDTANEDGWADLEDDLFGSD
jgi:hypothetical protein